MKSMILTKKKGLVSSRYFNRYIYIYIYKSCERGIAPNLFTSVLGLHQREVFLFNDILVITKIHSRKKNTVTYTFRQSYLLAGLSVSTFDTPHYPYGIRVTQKWDQKLVLTLNARNEHDRTKVLIYNIY